MNENSLTERYSRQISLPDIGETGQKKLQDATVLVIGAGGLGCPVLQYLTAAGIGNIGIADDDVICISNLQRQVLYTTAEEGLLKVDCAASKLQDLNPNITIRSIHQKITNQNAFSILNSFDIIIDCTDNFPSRYIINDACVLLNKPFISGSIYRYQAQIAVFNMQQSANYRDLYPVQPNEGEIQSCNEAGVLGVLTGIVGCMMASECIKLITGTGVPLINKVLLINIADYNFFEMNIENKAVTAQYIPSSKEEFEQKDYGIFSCIPPNYHNINPQEFNHLLLQENTIAVDVRNYNEPPVVTAFKHIVIPLHELEMRKHEITQSNVLLFCHSGIRSEKAALILSDGKRNVFNLKGGLVKWMAFHQK